MENSYWVAIVRLVRLILNSSSTLYLQIATETKCAIWLITSSNVLFLRKREQHLGGACDRSACGCGAKKSNVGCELCIMCRGKCFKVLWKSNKMSTGKSHWHLNEWMKKYCRAERSCNYHMWSEKRVTIVWSTCVLLPCFVVRKIVNCCRCRWGSLIRPVPCSQRKTAKNVWNICLRFKKVFRKQGFLTFQFSLDAKDEFEREFHAKLCREHVIERDFC